MSSIAVQHDLRARFGPARDQGARPACMVFAASDAHAGARGAWEELSCEYLYYYAKQRESTPPDVGTSLRAVREALEQDGQPLEIAWPYLSHLPADMSKWKPPADVGNVYYRPSQIVGSAFHDAWALVASGNAALVVTTISNAFYMPDAAGVIDSTEPIDPSRRHAVVATATAADGNARYLFVRNSWGESWGLAGNAWLAEAYADPRITHVIALF
jgi:C1A family cysteine protease